jgi:hypothetical protein
VADVPTRGSDPLERLIERLAAGPVAERTEAVDLVRQSGVTRAVARRELAAAVANGRLRRVGKGVRADPAYIALGVAEPGGGAPEPKEQPRQPSVSEGGPERRAEPEPRAERVWRQRSSPAPIFGAFCMACGVSLEGDPIGAGLACCRKCWES